MPCARVLIILSVAASVSCGGSIAAQPVDGVGGDRSALPLGAPSSGDGSGAVSGDNEAVGTPGAVGEVVRTVWPLAVVVGLIGLLAWGGRVYAKSRGGLLLSMSAGGRAPAGILTVLGRYPIGRGQTLVLLRCDARVLLLHQTGGSKGGATTLAEFSDPEEVASLVRKADAADGSGPGARFASMLGAARGSLETKPTEPSESSDTARACERETGRSYRRVISGETGDRAELLGFDGGDGNDGGGGSDLEPDFELGGLEDLESRLEALRRGNGSGVGVRA